MSLYRRRRARVLSLTRDYDSVLVVRPQNIFYLTDFWGGGCAFVMPDKTVLATSKMEETRASETGKEVEVVTAGSAAELRGITERFMRGKAVSDSYDTRFSCKVDEEAFRNARRRKDEEELDRIARASRLTDGIYSSLERAIRPGKTERDLAALAMGLATSEGLTPLAAEGALDPLIIASGEDGSYPHAGVTDRAIKEGDMVTVDLFFRFRGYCTDATRTFGVRRVSSEAKRAYAAVLEAQLAGVEEVKAGASCSVVDEAVRRSLGRGLGRYFTHGTGHGVGIDIHEPPYIGRGSPETLLAGEAVTVEPGVYFPGKFGIRIEDTIRVGRVPRNLHGYTKELLVLG